MRIFPCAARRRALAAAATITLGVLVVHGSLPSYADDRDDLKHQQHQVRGDLRAAGVDLQESSRTFRAASVALTSAQAQLVGARAELADVQDRLAAARAHDQEVAARLTAAQAALVQARQDVEDGKAAVVDQRTAVVDTVTSIYEQGDPQLMAISSLLESQDVEDLTRRTEFGRIAVDNQDQTYDDLRASEVILGVRAEEVADAEQAVTAQKAASAEQVAEVEGLEAQASAATTRVAGLVARSSVAKRSADAARDRDSAVLAKLRREDARIKRKIVAAAKAAARAAAAAAAAGQATGDYVGPSDGALLAPVTGPVTSPFGYRIHPIYGYYGLHDGTDFGVACGEGMRASADGTVTSQYYSDVYGNRLYLDVGRINGHAITVVYNHASSYRVGVGDKVSRGDIVGDVGSTGWSTGCHLHFTVLQDGTAVDPMGYL